MKSQSFPWLVPKVELRCNPGALKLEWRWAKVPFILRRNKLFSQVFDTAFDARQFSGGVFRFGSLLARLLADDTAYVARFRKIFCDCLEPSPSGPADLEMRVVAQGSDSVLAEISGHGRAVVGEALVALFPELELIKADCPSDDGWFFIARGGDFRRPVIRMRGNQILIDRELPWQQIISHYFVDHVLRQQPFLAYFHGATLAVGNNGILLSGSKGAGKSTLSLALAARGHGFLGDEIAIIDRKSRDILPFRRAASIRPGPQALAVERILEQRSFEWEVLPDATNRLRLPVADIFPKSMPRVVQLTHAFFLEGFQDTPKATEFNFSWAELSLPAPFRVTMQGKASSANLFMFFKLFSGIRCYKLSPGGDPDRTADLIESILEVR